MSIKKIRNGFDKIKEKGKEYFELDSERQEIENEKSELKDKYKEGFTDRGVFSERNKKIIFLKNKLISIKTDIEKISRDVEQEIQKEIQDAV